MRKHQAELSFEDTQILVNPAFFIPTPEPKKHQIRVQCLECSRTFRTSSMLPSCPGCGGSVVEIA